MERELEILKKEEESIIGIRPLIDDLPAKPKINRVVKVNKHTTVQFPEKMRVFGKTKAEILNFPDFSKLFKFPDVQKITGAVSVKFPDIQNVKGTVNAVVKFPEIFKVKVTNFPTQEKISFPETTKIEFNKDQQEFFRQLLRAMEFPLGQGGGVDSQKANPSRYMNVRITNGKQFVEAVHSINSNNGQLAQLLKEINNKTTSSSGGATEAKQDTQITLETQLNSLVDTLQELVQRLSPLAGAMNNTAQLRTVVTGAVTATGGGYITSAQAVAALLTQTTSLRPPLDNNLAIQSNINNAVGV